MSAENDSLKQLYHKGAKEFVSWMPKKGVIGYLLEEETTDAPIDTWGCFGVFPRLPIGSGELLFAIEHSARKLSNTNILKLQVPESVKRINVRDNPIFIRDTELRLAELYMPSKLLVFGRREDTGKDVAMIYCLAGVRPEDALREIQQMICKSSRSKNN